MSWSSSVFVGGLTAAVGLVASGFVANLAVGWYRISNFELKSAAFVASFAIFGLLAGLVIGLVTSRVLAGSGHPGFLVALGVSQGIVLGIVSIVGVTARLLADVPPKIDGQELMLAVEVRWPDGHATSPTTLPGEPHIILGSVTRLSHTFRASARGPLYVQDAHLVDGRWVAPGAVEIFTTRGRLVLDVVLDSSSHHGFAIPLSGSPGKGDMKWTEWYPHARPGSPPLPNDFTYRYRVQSRRDPVRIETFGSFTVATIAQYFFDQSVDGTTRLATMAEFAITHRGQPLIVQGPTSITDSTPMSFRRVDDIAAIAGPQPALLAHFFDAATSGACFLVVDQGERVRSDYVPNCVGASSVSPLTSDTARFRPDHGAQFVRGQFDHAIFAKPGLFLAGTAALDTRRLAVHLFDVPDRFSLVPSLPPLGVSPDERSFARFGYAESSDANPVILVIDVVANHNYMLPIDPVRMRFATIGALDPAWLLHHFAWQHAANGVDSLTERKDFIPIPYHGTLTVNGAYRNYRLEPAREALRPAFIDFLIANLNAKRIPMPPDASTYEIPVEIDGKRVNVSYASSYISVAMETGAPDTTLIETIAHRFDAALATGKYDALFGK